MRKWAFMMNLLLNYLKECSHPDCNVKCLPRNQLFPREISLHWEKWQKENPQHSLAEFDVYRTCSSFTPYKTNLLGFFYAILICYFWFFKFKTKLAAETLLFKSYNSSDRVPDSLSQYKSHTSNPLAGYPMWSFDILELFYCMVPAFGFLKHKFHIN